MKTQTTQRARAIEQAPVSPEQVATSAANHLVRALGGELISDETWSTTTGPITRTGVYYTVQVRLMRRIFLKDVLDDFVVEMVLWGESGWDYPLTKAAASFRERRYAACFDSQYAAGARVSAARIPIATGDMWQCASYENRERCEVPVAQLDIAARTPGPDLIWAHHTKR